MRFMTLHPASDLNYTFPVLVFRQYFLPGPTPPTCLALSLSIPIASVFAEPAAGWQSKEPLVNAEEKGKQTAE